MPKLPPPPPPPPPAKEFLRPSEEKKAKIKIEQEEKDRAKRAKTKQQAEVRKKQREADAARIAIIEENIKMSRTSTKTSAMPSQATTAINAYLDSPPYLGHSDIRDKDRIKELAGPASVRVWDPAKKMWGTKKLVHLEQLLRSGRWEPFGIEEEWHSEFVNAVKERVLSESAHAEAVSMVKQENSTRALEQAVQEAEASGAAAPLPTVLNVYERDEKEKKEMHLKSGGGPTQAEIDECARLGFTKQCITSSYSWAELGPCAGISNEGRLLRWVQIERDNARCDYDDRPALFFNMNFMNPIMDAAAQVVVKQLNARAGSA